MQINAQKCVLLNALFSACASIAVRHAERATIRFCAFTSGQGVRRTAVRAVGVVRYRPAAVTTLCDHGAGVCARTPARPALGQAMVRPAISG